MDPSQVYVGVLKDLVEKFGFSTGIAIFLIALFSTLIFVLLRSQIKAYQFTINTLNEQNKKYQDAFLNNRSSSRQKFLNERDGAQE
jgi:hypothetical protein